MVSLPVPVAVGKLDDEFWVWDLMVQTDSCLEVEINNLGASVARDS